MKSLQCLSALLLAGALPAAAADFQTFQPASALLGQPDFTSMSAVSGQPNRFSLPEGVAWDPATGKVFVADASNDRVLRFSSAAAAQVGAFPEAVFGQENFSGSGTNQGGAANRRTLSFPFGICLDAQGRLWVADQGNNRVLGFYLASYLGNNPPADLVLGQPDFTTVTSGVSDVKMNTPAGVSVGPDDSLWVADAGNSRVLRFANVTSKVSGGSADGVLGQPNFTDFAAAVASDRLNQPFSLFADAAGRLWVSDTFNFRVLRFDDAAVKPNGAPADAVIGQPDFTTNTSGLSATKFSATYGVLFDDAGDLWVSDYNHDRVLRFPDALAIAAGGTADIVIGKPDFTTATGPASDRMIGGPSQIARGPGGSLLVVDYDYNRVLRFDPVATPPTLTVNAPASTTKARLTLRGTATNATRVEVKVGRAAYRRAVLTGTNWRFAAKLNRGRNRIEVRAIGPDGTSPVRRVTITRR